MAVIKIPRRNKVRRGRFILTYSLEGYSSSQQERHVRKLLALQPQSGSIVMNAVPGPSLPPIQPRILEPWISPSHLRDCSSLFS